MSATMPPNTAAGFPSLAKKIWIFAIIRGVLGIIFGLIAGLIGKAIMPGKDPGGWIVTILLALQALSWAASSVH